MHLPTTERRSPRLPAVTCLTGGRALSSTNAVDARGRPRGGTHTREVAGRGAEQPEVVTRILAQLAR